MFTTPDKAHQLPVRRLSSRVPMAVGVVDGLEAIEVEE